MGITMTEQILGGSWANGEQGAFADDGIAINMAITLKEEIEEQNFTRQDFEDALKKVCRKVKK